jgi:hypothetical protein
VKITVNLYKPNGTQPEVSLELEDYNSVEGTTPRTFVVRNANLGHNLVRDVFVDVEE